MVKKNKTRDLYRNNKRSTPLPRHLCFESVKLGRLERNEPDSHIFCVDLSKFLLNLAAKEEELRDRPSDVGGLAR